MVTTVIAMFLRGGEVTVCPAIFTEAEPCCTPRCRASAAAAANQWSMSALETLSAELEGVLLAVATMCVLGKTFVQCFVGFPKKTLRQVFFGIQFLAVAKLWDTTS